MRSSASEHTSDVCLIEELVSPRLQLNTARERIHSLILQLLRAYVTEFARKNGDEDTNLSFGANCLTDITSTAAIVREIIFGPKQTDFEEDIFVGYDFGTGSGILTLAATLAARRLGYPSEKIFVTGFDMHGQDLTPVNDTLNTFLHPSKYPNVTVRTGDILDPSLHKTLSVPRMWISETITSLMPGIVVEASRVRRAYDRQSNIVAKVFQLADPFVDVLATASECHPSLVADVRSGKIWMWPDPINQKLLIKNNIGSIYLETSENPGAMFLWEIGSDFYGKDICDTPSSRFPKPGEKFLNNM